MDFKEIIIEKYKCFNDVKISGMKDINVIIGKNNIGKSSILDVIEMIFGNRKIYGSLIHLTKELDDSVIKSVFSSSVGGGGVPGVNHYEFGKKFINQDITFLRKNDEVNDMSVDFAKYNSHLPQEQLSYWIRCAQNIKISTKNTKRILAERNIFPEDNIDDMKVDSNGNGITKVITNYINRSKYDEKLVKVELLDKLNEIMKDDAEFTEIVTQQVETNDGVKWEIFLREEGKGRIALSESGSGLKTILMVLVYTILIPDIEEKELSDYIFLFEELENNLHPSLQRRLLSYIEYLTKKGAIFFLTTHSNVILDSYQNSDLVNVLHVQKINDKVDVYNVTDKIQKNSILDDLGLKASDLLQANGVIWVEGPSDRVYINKWLELFGNFDFREGKDYQCVFYGGRLLSNLSLEDEDELINLMSVNRNAIIVLDSDKKSSNAPLNNTKKRILEEARKSNVLTWLTKGREIENYLSGDYLKMYYKKEKSRMIFGQFQKIDEFLEKLKKGEGKKFLKNKTEFARNILKDSSIVDFENVYDLKKMIGKVETEILCWNYVDNSKGIIIE